MKLIALCAFGLLATAAFAQTPKTESKPCLCTSGEENIFSFGTNTGKTLSLCAGPKESYLVYRFGRTGKVEMQYPSKLDATSWKKFKYKHYLRPGGSENLGLDLNRLIFTHKGVTYEVFDDWAAGETADDPGSDSQGVEVIVNGKRTSISAKAGTDSGSMLYFIGTRVPEVEE